MYRGVTMIVLNTFLIEKMKCHRIAYFVIIVPDDRFFLKFSVPEDFDLIK